MHRRTTASGSFLDDEFLYGNSRVPCTGLPGSRREEGERRRGDQGRGEVTLQPAALQVGEGVMRLHKRPTTHVQEAWTHGMKRAMPLHAPVRAHSLSCTRIARNKEDRKETKKENEQALSSTLICWNAAEER